jgi:endoglucanase
VDDAYAYAGCTNDVIAQGPHKPSTGGWHDAGDYGKKIVAASDALGYLLMACEDLPERAQALQLNVPGNGPLPDMWREIQYELDWFLTEQEADGSVQALITSQDFYVNGMPQQDGQARFRVGVSSCATADFAAILARAARVYARFDQGYADRCLAAARRAWSWLIAHPEIVPAGGYHDPVGIHGTGTYDDSDDRDERFWAACELYVTTGEREFNRWVRSHYSDFGGALFEPPGYLHTQGFGLYAYTLSRRGDADLREKFRAAILAYAARAREAIRGSPYGITADLTPYWWNNCTALQSTAALVVAERLEPKAGYGEAAWRQLYYGLGCNPVDRCYITGFGARPVSDPWQPASVYDGVGSAIPGFVLPGANLVAWDLPLQRYREVHHLAPLKAYRDDHRMASVNEVCLNYDGPFVFVTLALGR